MAEKLHIDIETFSSTDLKTSGVYKYAESLDFEILLVAYAFGNGLKVIIDLAGGESLPHEFISALMDPTIEKHAHNANFERQCFKAYGYDVPARQWFCSAVKAAYCGLPLSLGGVSEALSLEERGKSATGKALIRYFCIPCKPTKTNGQRERNLPEHNPKKWAEFKVYCLQDVEAEREVSHELSPYEIPAFERENYILDQEINDRGIEIDEDFVRTALELDAKNSEELRIEMKKLTGLENPNSPAQLKKWLSDAMQRDITTLAKDEIPKLIEEAGPGTASEVLKLRQRSSKTSIKKYVAMLKCVCEDGRARGLFQFYGAMRTGRWAGRLIQLQNLPRNYVKDLEVVRDIVETGDYELAKMTLGNVSDILSQLIRTAFVAKEGHLFCVADYSAIEARVIAWLAGERWRLDVFNTHGKIYEASAAMMFNVDIEEVTKGSEYRSKGKIAELALGYQGSIGAMEAMGAAEEGLSRSQMKDVVDAWRAASPSIVKMWRDIDKSSKDALRRQGVDIVLRNLTFHYDGKFLTIELPSGRKLFYQSPQFTLNRFENESIRYKGMDQNTKKWGWVDTYGGKLTENIVQAIARDLLVYSMQNLKSAGFDTCMHVHDEAICEERDLGSTTGLTNERMLEYMCDVMAQGPDWAEGLPLNADGYITPFYKKD